MELIVEIVLNPYGMIFQYLMMLTVSLMATSCYYDEMPAEETVEWWRDCLRTELFNLVDFTATIGLIKLSTHDDGEATFTAGSSQQALELLPRLIGEQAAACVIPYLQANLDCYISVRNSQPTVHTTFEEYLVGA